MSKSKSTLLGKKIDLNPQFMRALDLMENTDKNVFVTGRAGTGKSTLLELFRTQSKKKVVVLAPTGVAAINVRGQTIHSFFRFRPDVTLDAVKKRGGRSSQQSLYKKLDAIVIDEVSMVRADLMDCIDRFLRLNAKNKTKPFGGVQMLFIGDLYQLPPVVTGKEREIFRTLYESPYFFDAHCFKSLPMEFIELEKIYRQTDQIFIDLLNKIRNNTAAEPDLDFLNQKCDEEFIPESDSFFIYLTTTNKMAADINSRRLSRLKTKEHIFEGHITGSFEQKHLPTLPVLSVKSGAQVMLLNNDSYGRWVNGTVGKIVKIEYDEEFEGDVIWVELADGEVEPVTPYTWELYRYQYNQDSQSLQSETVGTFTQYPLRLAWAVTIHKSQGKTFERVIIDIGRGTFAHGQMYVALSRCTSLDGLILKKPLQKKHIWMDWRVVKFLTRYQYQLADKEMSVDDKTSLIKAAIKKKAKLKMTYLKPNDTKSKRTIEPKKVGEMSYLGKSFLGVEAFCLTRKADRVFRVDRILEIAKV